jgi:signal transduction histidine kinase
MNKNEVNRVAYLSYGVAIILLAVCCWDIWALKVSGWSYYYPFKITTLLIFFISGYMVQKEKLKPLHGMDLTIITFYLYSYIGTVYLHPTYVFAFYEGLFIICFMYLGTFLRYALLTSFGLILTFLSLHHLPAPDFIKEGYSIIPHLQMLTVILCLMSFIVYWLFNRQRELIYMMDQKFASIGRQSAFLLHELKSPLNRFIARSVGKGSRDAEYIYSIIEGVELLVSHKKEISFREFNWEDIREYLADEFKEACQHYGINLEIVGLEGRGFGHPSALKLALKNLIKNAVESIAHEGLGGTVKVKNEGNIIEISNDGILISKEQMGELFKPFYSKKNTGKNLGIGLHFVESVIQAHDGHISVGVIDNWNVFKIKLGR